MTEHGEHVHRDYVKVWRVLVILLIISVAGPFLGVRVITLITAFGIALVKAYIVAKNFMHLDVEKPIVHYFLAISLVFMVLLFSGISPDVMEHEGQQWENRAAKEAVQRGEAEGATMEHGHK